MLSKLSKQRLSTCHEDLQKLVEAVAEEEKCAVICGYRGRYEQEEAYFSGKSKAMWGKSKHNLKPSMAVDVVPIPLNWEDIDSFEKLGKTIMQKAKDLNINIKWGRDFKGLKDYPHYELC